ncbi:MAG: DnaJ domain-containing protein [Chitinivibrionales bacterium]|nr:DnaJ domain-containing protein [Chitinivibrionales bacterium]
MNYKNYYTILGVPQTATSEDIKKAYRKLALKYHPDKTKGNAAALERFLDINEANTVLSDSEKRKKYDQFGADFKQYEEAGAQPGGFDWSRYASSGGRQESPSREEFEAMFTGQEDFDLFELLFGERDGRRQGRRSRVIKGEDLTAETTLSLEESYHGTTRLIQRDGQTIRVTVPRGVADQQSLRIPAKGMPGFNGGQNGDLYLTVKIALHPEFHRKGNDLYRHFPVELYTMILGGKALVKTLKGAVKVDIPKETPNHKVLRLHGLGMPVQSKKNEFGDLYVTVDIQLPNHLTEQEIDLFRKLSALRK